MINFFIAEVALHPEKTFFFLRKEVCKTLIETEATILNFGKTWKMRDLKKFLQGESDFCFQQPKIFIFLLFFPSCLLF